MSRRGKRTPEELAKVHMSDWTPKERERMDDNKTYTVTKGGTRYVVTGKISAQVIAGKDGTIQEGRHIR